MAISNLITEDGNKLVQETVAGIIGASILNDTKVESIISETFSSDPVLRSWLFGVNWQWDNINLNMKAV